MISYNKSIDEGSFVGVQARYAHARRGFANERSVRLSYGRRLDRATNLVFDADWSRGIRGDDQSFPISLVRRFGIRSSARAEHATSNARVRPGSQDRTTSESGKKVYTRE